LLVFVVLQAACIKKTTRLPQSQRPLPAMTATRSELFQSLQEKSKQIKTLKAIVDLDLSRGARSGVLDEYRQTRGNILVDRPAHIRIEVRLPIVLTTVAVMVSDGQEYRISIPIKNQFAIQDVDAPVNAKSSLSNLRPQIFLDGLFVDVSQYADRPSVHNVFEEAVVGIHSYYVFSFFETQTAEPELLQKIWIDRTNLEVVRKQVFGKEGRLETDVDYENYRTGGDISFPGVVVIHRPIEDLTVKVTFQQSTLNDTLETKIFDLPRPEGSQLVQVTQ
jgi:outer membrane lipoprotein-sorting protein